MKVRKLDQSQIGRVLTNDPEALRHGPPVKAMLVQNTNPVSVAPEQELVKQGFARRGSVRLCSRAIHDRNGALRRYRAARHHVHGA